MTSPEEKERVLKKRKRNSIQRTLREHGATKGPFSLKVINSRKSSYKREKINKKEIIIHED